MRRPAGHARWEARGVFCRQSVLIEVADQNLPITQSIHSPPRSLTFVSLFLRSRHSNTPFCPPTTTCHSLHPALWSLITLPDRITLSPVAIAPTFLRLPRRPLLPGFSPSSTTPPSSADCCCWITWRQPLTRENGKIRGTEKQRER